jgi:hypothetical protein
VGGKGSGGKNRIDPVEHLRRSSFRPVRHAAVTPRDQQPDLRTYLGLCRAWDGLPDMAAHIVQRVVQKYPSIDWPDMPALHAYARAFDVVWQLKKARAAAVDVARAEQHARALWFALREAHQARLAAKG